MSKQKIIKKISKRLTISCGIVLVNFTNDEPRFLMLRSHDYWDFAKGRSEKGESYIDTALRETEEETSIRSSNIKFRWGLVYKDTELYKKGTKYAKYFIAETDTLKVHLPVSRELGKPEHDEFRWVTFDEGIKLAGKRIKKILEWANNIVTEDAE